MHVHYLLTLSAFAMFVMARTMLVTRVCSVRVKHVICSIRQMQKFFSHDIILLFLSFLSSIFRRVNIFMMACNPSNLAKVLHNESFLLGFVIP